MKVFMLQNLKESVEVVFWVSQEDGPRQTDGYFVDAGFPRIRARQTDEHLNVFVSVILTDIVEGVAPQEHGQLQNDEFVVDFAVSQLLRER